MLFNYTEHPGKTRLASLWLQFMGRVLFRLRYHVRVEADPQIHKTGPVLIISKHCTESDIPLGYPAMVQIFGRHAWCVMKASLARPRYMGFFWKIGGIPLDRDNPDRSKKFLVFAKKVLYEGHPGSWRDDGQGNLMVLFPEQTTFFGSMGEGKVAGFRFIAGKPERPLACTPVGLVYEPGFPRTRVTVRFGATRFFTKEDDPAVFLDGVMREIAKLSGLEYPYPVPEARKKGVEVRETN